MTTANIKSTAPADQEIKPGYKKTKLGWIPEEWKVSTLSDLCDFSTGKNIKQKEASPNYKIPCVRYGELYHLYNEVINEVINKTNLDKSQLKFSLGNEILLPSAGEDPFDIGSASALTIKNVAIGRTINILRPKKDNLYSQIFLSYYINQKLRKKIASLAKGVSISNVYNSDLKQLKLLLPPLPEQKKIADILSTWDKAIETTQGLIKTLQLRKKGLMQQLLTGKKRLPGFSGEWIELNLSELGTFLKGKGLPKKSLSEKGIACIRYGELYTVHHSIVREFYSFISREVSDSSVRLKNGDILFACSGETLNEIGKSAAFVSDDEVYAGGDIIILRQNQNDPRFIGYLFDTDSFIRKRRKFGQGQSVLHIYKSGLERIRIELPKVKEQTAIAQVLTKADEEINQTQNYLEQLQEQKKGLMQQLLTGQRRVAV